MRAGKKAIPHLVILLRVACIVLILLTAGCGDRGGGYVVEPGASAGPGPGNDTTPPTILSTAPGSNINGIKINASINVTFSEYMDASTINSSTFILRGPGNSQISGNVVCSGTVATFTPTSYLSTSTTYTATITTGVTDWSGNHLANNFSWPFTTSASSDVTSPTVVATFPAADAFEVKVYSSITVTFSESMLSSTITPTTFTVMDDKNNIVHGTLTCSDSMVSFVPDDNLSPKTTYSVRITTDAMDLAGNPLQTYYFWNFRTGYANSELLTSYQTFTTGAYPAAVAIGDINDDGRPDVVIVNSSYGDANATNINKIVVFLQNSDGTLAPAAAYNAHGGSSIAIGDINNDGKNEIVVGVDRANIEVFALDGSNGLISIATYTTINSTIIRIADLNNDGRLDVAGIGWGTDTMDVFLQNASGTLDGPITYSVTHGGWDDLAVGDVNNDGLTDIIVMSGQGYAYPNFGVLTQKTEGTFSNTVYYNLGGNRFPGGVAVGDVNGDSLNDVVVASAGVTVFLQNTAGLLSSPIDYQSSGMHPQIADINQDGRNDVVVVSPGGGNIGIYLQASDGTFLPEEFYTNAYGSGSLQPLAVGDINNDGRHDVVTLDDHLGLVILYHK